MANKLLDSGAVSAFCESMALMIATGIQTDEAVHMLAENMERGPFKDACDNVYISLIKGLPFALALEKSYVFPQYMVDMVKLGESTGHLESVLRALSVYYDEECRLFTKIRTSIGHPTALLCVMTLILAFTVFFILPVFDGVYRGFSGGLTAGSVGIIGVSTIIGCISLAISVVVTLVSLYAFSLTATQKGRKRIMKLFSHIPMTKKAVNQLALSRFTSTIAIYVASGANTDAAMRRSLGMIESKALGQKVHAAYQAMINPKRALSLPQAISEFGIFEPVYARMLLVGNRTGALEEVLEKLSNTFFEDAFDQLDRSVEGIEPAIAAFITVAIGLTLISVMLPLIGIMGSIR